MPAYLSSSILRIKSWFSELLDPTAWLDPDLFFYVPPAVNESWGMLAELPAVVASGGTIIDDGQYRTHVFSAVGSNTFTLTSRAPATIPFEYLVVGGGGGGGSCFQQSTGGGGGGRVLTGIDTLSPGSFGITVGAGGLNDGSGNAPGGSSVFNAHTAAGGGMAGLAGAGGNGASGGGGGGGYGGTVAGGTGTGGFNGGTGNGSTVDGNLVSGGGGGGAGAVGTAGSTSNGGVGGAGVVSSLLGVPLLFGSGGGGGKRGTGTPGSASSGAGRGSLANNGIPGMNGRGGGGGGSGSDSAASWSPVTGLGGSGLVAIRYPYISIPPKLPVLDSLVTHLDASKPLSAAANEWTDISGNNRHALTSTDTGAPAFAATAGGVITLDDAEFMRLPGISVLTRFTIEVWVKPVSLPANNGAFVSDYYPSYVNYAINYNGVSGQVISGFYNGAWYQTPTVTVAAGSWYQLVLTYDGANLSLYKNNAAPVQSACTATPASSAAEVHIGRRWDNPDYAPGDYGIVRIYSRALTAAEVAQNWNASRARFGL